MRYRTLRFAFRSIVTMTVVGIATLAVPLANAGVVWDNWGTQFTTNPLMISSPGTVSTTEFNILPGNPFYTVDRTTTWQYLSGSGTATAMTLPINDPGCLTAMPGDGCLKVHADTGVTADLDIAYTFSNQLTFVDNVMEMEAFVFNTGTTSYTVEADYCAVMGGCSDPNSANWKLGELYTVNPGADQYYLFGFNATTNEVRLKYDFTGNDDVELCCVGPTTPEPSTLVMLGSAAAGLAGSDALGFTNFGLLGLAGALRRKPKR